VTSVIPALIVALQSSVNVASMELYSFQNNGFLIATGSRMMASRHAVRSVFVSDS